MLMQMHLHVQVYRITIAEILETIEPSMSVPNFWQKKRTDHIQFSHWSPAIVLSQVSTAFLSHDVNTYTSDTL